MSANEYYNRGQGGYYPPPSGAPAGQYYPQQPQQPQQSYQGYGGPPQGPPPPQGYGPGPGYGPPPPQTVYVQEQPAQNDGFMACLAGMCLCCCAEELCCLFV
ncbi:hypothetical protein AX14_009120 [Amanita brunnescens Koide BX004]|nr:hypothetical protein AX14_009120 [Amanita brunnescens Koide BX004]